MITFSFLVLSTSSVSLANENVEDSAAATANAPDISSEASRCEDNAADACDDVQACPVADSSKAVVGDAERILQADAKLQRKGEDLNSNDCDDDDALVCSGTVAYDIGYHDNIISS